MAPWKERCCDEHGGRVARLERGQEPISKAMAGDAGDEKKKARCDQITGQAKGARSARVSSMAQRRSVLRQAGADREKLVRVDDGRQAVW
jgi:hypothetical protein